MKKQAVWLLAALATVLVAGCANQKAPAEQAVQSAETALAEVRDVAQKYAPDQEQAVEAQLNSMKASLAKGDYKAVLSAAPAVTSAIGSLKDTAAAKKAEAEAAQAKAKDAWGSMNTVVPQMIAAIQTRLDTLSKSKHLPQGLTKDGFDAAKSGLASLKSMWSDASNAAAAGDYTTAMSKAQAAHDKGMDIMRSLGMASS